MGKVQEMNNEIIAELRKELEELEEKLNACQYQNTILEKKYKETKSQSKILKEENEELINQLRRITKIVNE